MTLSQVTYIAAPQRFFTLRPTGDMLQHVPCQFFPPILPCQGSRDTGSALVAHHIPYAPLHLLSITHLTWEDLQSWSHLLECWTHSDLANCNTVELYREMESLVHQLPCTLRLPGTLCQRSGCSHLQEGLLTQGSPCGPQASLCLPDLY